ncbi:sigma-54-dependent Fis family transcriptional regulator [Piscinibacter sp.]|uniref:sigma-54-dependent Fis family transcriptional regulator n=1 Tax=Piscinibacter sp. TaxID=1903157 RepID=UPI0039E6B5D5
MGPNEERALAHAMAVRSRGAALPPGGLPPPEILDSWVRCSRAGLDLASNRPIRVVESADLARRREQAEVVRRLALAELETLTHQIAGSNFMLAFADPEGVLLDQYADNRFLTSGSASDLITGSLWAESLAGTNGLGTALATGRPVAVNGLEHYLFKYGDISCTAAPIRDAYGQVVGALDASSYFESRQRHTQALVQMSCTHIEKQLLLYQMRERLVLAVHPRAEFLGTLSAGLLAFDAGGRLLAFNARARDLLSGLDVNPGTPFEQLFDAPYELFVAGLHSGGERRLRDALGSELVASCVQAPARAMPRAALPHAPRAAAPVAEPAPAPSPAPTARSSRLVADFVADDAAVRAALDTVAAALRLNAPLLILGETGTGKELLARHAHRASGRGGAFVAVNCGALPAELFEAELFGYVGGAFTGARREGSAGMIASADGGTLLLDEIGELPLAMQAALLRLLDDWRVRPIGGTAARRVDVQLLAATHVDLEQAVRERRFRADLLHRLATVRVELPPLRARSDFAAVARCVLEEVRRDATLSEAAIAWLARHDWSGNMRELRAVLTRALLACPPGALDIADVQRVLPLAAASPETRSALARGAFERVVDEFERCGRSVSRTSRSLGISRTTVYRYLRQR